MGLALGMRLVAGVRLVVCLCDWLGWSCILQHHHVIITHCPRLIPALRHLWLIVSVYSTTSPSTRSGVFQTKHQLTKSTPDTEIKVPSPENPELTNIIGGSHKYHFCRDKHVSVTTKHVFCRDKSMLAATKLLSRHECICRDKYLSPLNTAVLVAAPGNDKRMFSL